MAKQWKVELDRAGVGAILKSAEAHEMVNDVAGSVASNAAANVPSKYDDATVRVDEYTTDRGAAAVVLEHQKGAGIESKYGPLSKGAASAGVKVTG